MIKELSLEDLEKVIGGSATIEFDGQKILPKTFNFVKNSSTPKRRKEDFISISASFEHIIR